MKPDGTISTAYGTYGSGPDPTQAEGQPASAVRFASGTLESIAAGRDGSLFLADRRGYIWRITPEGTLHRLAGTGGTGSTGDGGPATSAQINWPRTIAVGSDGSVYFTAYSSGDGSPSIVRKVDSKGIITTIAGNGTVGSGGNNGPAQQAQLYQPWGLALDPDGNLYIADPGNQRVRRLQAPLPGFSQADYLIPSEDAAIVYRFDSTGRHVSTLHALTGAVIYSFGYDTSGLLTQVMDADGNVTTVQHDGAGHPTAIVAPFGQQTTLAVDANGYLAAITDPAGDANGFTYTPDGLMLTRTDPRQNTYHFTHDSLGRLTLDEDPASGSQSLSRSEQPGTYTVVRQTAEGRVTQYQVDRLANGAERHVTTAADSTQTQLLLGKNSVRTLTTADGNVDTLTQGGDSRFGLQSPVAKSNTITTPGGRSLVSSAARFVSLSNPDNPLSVTALTETTTRNGRTFSKTFNASTRQFTLTTPESRQIVATIDSIGRVVSSQVAGLSATTYGYDARGRLSSVSQGSGADTRLFTLAYEPSGFLDAVTDPQTQVTSFDYDLAGRVTVQTRPDLTVIGFGYDANGNPISVTPPSRPAHGFGYTAVDLPSLYTPPTVPGTGATQYTYNRDRQLSLDTRPGGRASATATTAPGGSRRRHSPTGRSRTPTTRRPEGSRR